MWKKIDNNETYCNIKVGNLISQKPNRRSGKFMVGSRKNDYLEIYHSDDHLDTIILLEGELISGDWYVNK